MIGMLMKIGGLEKQITEPWMPPLAPCLLKDVKIPLRLILKFAAGILRTKAI
jgi:hypothetical protein